MKEPDARCCPGRVQIENRRSYPEFVRILDPTQRSGIARPYFRTPPGEGTPVQRGVSVEVEQLDERVVVSV